MFLKRLRFTLLKKPKIKKIRFLASCIIPVKDITNRRLTPFWFSNNSSFYIESWVSERFFTFEMREKCKRSLFAFFKLNRELTQLVELNQTITEVLSKC